MPKPKEIMIRLYLDEAFQRGQRLRLSKKERRYYKTVRREQGEVRLFNRGGQEALGQFEEEDFVVTDIRSILLPVRPLHFLVGLPENAVVRKLILSLSEMGVETLTFFVADRSQSGSKRLSLINKEQDKFDDLAIEAMRQCERPRPLKIDAIKKLSGLSLESFDRRFFFDEAPAKVSKPSIDAQQKLLVVIGPEGGWSEKEREWFQANQFTRIHLPTPVLRVHTACIAAAAWCLNSA